MWVWWGGLTYSAQHVALEVMSSPRVLNGALTTAAHTSPSAATSAPLIPPVMHTHTTVKLPYTGDCKKQQMPSPLPPPSCTCTNLSVPLSR